MAKFASNGMLDATLLVMADNFNRVYLCSAQPADASGITAVNLGDAAMTVGDGNDYTVAAGDVSGRKVTAAAKSVTISTGGDITHVVYANDAALTASDDFYVTTCSSRTVIASDVVNLAAVDLENRQVT